MILEDEAATTRAGTVLAAAVRAGDVITLSGPLGVGKTALARGLIAALGLGLPLTRQFIEAHGGTVELQSKKGKGTTVKLTIPRGSK